MFISIESVLIGCQLVFLAGMIGTFVTVVSRTKPPEWSVILGFAIYAFGAVLVLAMFIVSLNSGGGWE